MELNLISLTSMKIELRLLGHQIKGTEGNFLRLEIVMQFHSLLVQIMSVDIKCHELN